VLEGDHPLNRSPRRPVLPVGFFRFFEGFKSLNDGPVDLQQALLERGSAARFGHLQLTTAIIIQPERW
jgi:hypothetical protein